MHKVRTAKLVQYGSSQALILPKEFEFSGDRVFIKKVGHTVVLIPYQEPWQSLFDSLDQFSDDFMDSREQPEGQTSKT
jgi:antitoxin VapB